MFSMPKQGVDMTWEALDLVVRKTIVLLLLLALLLCFVGCEIVNSDGNPITQPTRPTANDWDELDLDPELRQAIESRSSGILWRIPAEFQPEGTVSVRSYTRLDCAALWPELREAVFPKATQSSETQKDGSREIAYSDGTQSFSVQINAASLYLKGLPQEHAQMVLEKISGFLEQKLGFALRQWTGMVPEDQWLSYGLVIDEVPLDVKTDSTVPVSCLFAQSDGTIVLRLPILPGAAQESYELSGRMSPNELRKTAETGWLSDLPMVMELTECSLIYFLDSDEMKIRPGWSLTGTGYDYDTGKMTPVEMLIDAMTGEFKRMR